MANKKITCPFCFETFGLSQVKYRCFNPRCRGWEEDQIYADARGALAVPMGHVFAAPQSDWRQRAFRKGISAKCDMCVKPTSKRLCPQCHFELSHVAGQIDDHVIAVIGGRETGKGHYIATLVHRLEQEVGSQFGFGFSMQGDETRTRFENDYRTPLFHRKSLIAPTQSATVDIRTKTPMVFRLKSTDGRRLWAINLSFFDSAGEDMTSLDTLAAEARYICSASGIIFLLDPLQIKAIRQRYPGDDLPEYNGLAEPAYIVERLRELFERQTGVPATTKVKTPVAFVLSKVDTLLPMIDPGSALRMTGEHFGHFNLSDAQSVHTEIWNYLQSWMGSGFCNRVEADFQTYHYFGVSSLGRPPMEGRRVETVSPIRIEDPFLWVLYQLGLIKGRKGG